jgi:glycosyltransferase involved in cell wall biosynthesis
MQKISIITINYNDKVGLEKTLNSVVNQTFKEFEYIVIDGGSTDGSKEFLEQNADKITYWISEKDSGIYNAMNKGIRIAKGDYLLFLNSGDDLCTLDILKQVEQEIDGTKDLYYGDAIFKYSHGDNIVKFPDKLTFEFFTHNSLCHQASFIKRTLFEDIFYYNEDLKIISDWEFMVYSLCIKNISYKHLDINVSFYSLDGISSNPNSKVVIKQETDIVMNKYFPMFISDYDNFVETKNELTNLLRFKRVEQLYFIKKFPIAWSFLRGFMNFILLFLPKSK